MPSKEYNDIIKSPLGDIKMKMFVESSFCGQRCSNMESYKIQNDYENIYNHNSIEISFSFLESTKDGSGISINNREYKNLYYRVYLNRINTASNGSRFDIGMGYNQYLTSKAADWLKENIAPMLDDYVKERHESLKKDAMELLYNSICNEISALFLKAEDLKSFNDRKKEKIKIT